MHCIVETRHAVGVGCFLVRVADMDDFTKISDIYPRSSLSNEGDRAVLLANPEALVFESTPIWAGRTRVALDDGRIVGFATTRSTADITELDDLFVEPDWFRRGVGRTLVLDAVASARATGSGRLEVTANPHALSFYESVGLVADGATSTPFGIGTRMHLDVTC
jgi:GNAT superfamily N-acetyltransferase